MLSEKTLNYIYVIHIASSWGGAIMIIAGMVYLGITQPETIGFSLCGVSAKVISEWAAFIRARSSDYKVWKQCHLGGLIMWSIALLILIGVLVFR